MNIHLKKKKGNLKYNFFKKKKKKMSEIHFKKYNTKKKHNIIFSEFLLLTITFKERKERIKCYISFL